MKKVKNVMFRITIKGNGIVNYDSGEQKNVWKEFKNKKEFDKKNDNYIFAKKNYYSSSDGELEYKTKISSDCLRHNIFIDDIPFQSPNIASVPELLLQFIASPAALTRGYFFGVRGDSSIKRSTKLDIIDAEQTNNAISDLEFFSRSGEKNDTSIFNKETIGNVEYKTNGSIDLEELQFCSCDEKFDRYSFNPDLFPQYKKILQTKLKSFNSELGFYKIKGTCIDISEYGFKLSNDDMLSLIKYLFIKILKLNIKRSKAFAKTDSLEYKLVYDPFEDKLNDNEGWITINNLDDINNINFEIEDHYIKTDTEDSLAIRKTLDDKAKEKKEIKDKENKEKREYIEKKKLEREEKSKNI